MAGNPYDWNIGQNFTAPAMGLSEMIVKEKQLREQQNAQQIENRKNQLIIDKATKEEERLSKKLNINGWLLSQGMHPDDAKTTIDGWRSIGLVADNPAGLPEMEMRNLPTALEYWQKQPDIQMNVAKQKLTRTQALVNQFQDEMNKEIEKDQLNFKTSKKYNEALQKKTMAETQLAESTKQLEDLQLAFDPKLRETQEEKRLAREQKAEEVRIRQEETARHNKATEEAQKDSIDIKRILASVAAMTAANNAGNKEEVKSLKRQTDFANTLSKVQPEIDKIDKAWDEGKISDVNEYNRRVRNIKSIYGKQLEPFRKDGLWHGWEGEQKSAATTDTAPKGYTWNGSKMVPNK